jgi:hypothetical protein
MRKPAVNCRRRSRAGILLLALLLFRAYVPAGFMPASGVPFALELCPVAMAGMPAASHHHATHADFSTCPFGSTPAAGPISHHIDFQSPGPALSHPIVAFQTPRLSLRPQRTHLPRGPPSLA